MAEGAKILGPDGNPVRVPRSRALAGGSGPYAGPPYDAADVFGQHMAAWQPYLWSPDVETNLYRDRIVARIRDLVRNDGWAAGTVTRILDNAIGGSFRPIAKPDYKYLSAITGISGFDHAWSKEFAREVDARWRQWSRGMGNWCDASRNMTFPQLMHLGFRHKLVDGDALAVMAWIPERLGPGMADYATAVQIIDPDRLSNPMNMFDMPNTRGGVEIDKFGAAVGYHIRQAHFGDWFAAAKSMTWDYIPRETPWGRAVVVHDFDSDRAATHRGGVGIFAPVVARMKMLAKYDGVELDAAVINSIFAAYIESPMDPQLVTEALDDGEKLDWYQRERAAFHGETRLTLGNARIPILFPGEKITATSPTRPNTNFQQFEAAVLRNIASGTGTSAQQVSNNWSDVNYSSARGALLEAWKTLTRRREAFTDSFAGPIRACWMEEAFEVDDLPLPNGAPPFYTCRAAYSRARWMGPPMGWIDPVAERQGAILGMQAGLTTLEDECAAQGLDFEEVLDQRRYEIELFHEYGMELPDWAGNTENNKSQARPSDKPQPPPTQEGPDTP